MPGTKRRAEGEESDLLTIRPLGAGQEVGRSCIMLQYKGKKIMLDCGLHPGLHGLDALPYTDLIEPEEIELLLVTHFHLDHCGALPWFLSKTSFKGRVFMTHATKAIYRWLLADYIKVSNITADHMLYTEKDLEKSLDRIEVVNFHQEVEVGGVKFWAYTAGHVLGAAMFMIEIAGVKVLYTGDFSREEDRHLMAAEVPTVAPDVMIMESTYGTHVHEKREDREARFTGTIHHIVTRGGHCLIPVFALGRAQELLLILDDYWASHPELHDVPVYYASTLAKKCMTVYQTFIGAMNEKIKRQLAISNPFVFKHISSLKSVDDYDSLGPCVIMASPGMMQSGLSRDLFEAWCTDRRNGVIVAGYSVEGTLAKHILTQPSEITSMGGKKLPLRMSVDYISFSAHVDYEQSRDFVKLLKPPHLVLVHGEQNEMSRLKAALEREYDEERLAHIEIYTPRNTQAVELHFKGEKIAKVVGSLAGEELKEGQCVSGVLAKRGFKYHLIDPAELPSYTDLSTCSITQRLVYVSHTPLVVLCGYLERLSPGTHIEEVANKKIIKVFNGAVQVYEEKESTLIIEWEASSVNDMFADAVVTAMVQVEQRPVPIKGGASSEERPSIQDVFVKLMGDQYGVDHINVEEDGQLKVAVGEESAVVDLVTLGTAEGKVQMTCSNDDLHKHLSAVIRRLCDSFRTT